VTVALVTCEPEIALLTLLKAMNARIAQKAEQKPLISGRNLIAKCPSVLA